MRFRLALLLISLLAFAGRASAQGSPESYFFEVNFNWWRVIPQIELTAGAGGTPVDFVSEFELEQQKFREYRLVGKFGRHKARYGSLPIKYEATAITTQPFVFQGVAYPAGVPVRTEYNWTVRHVGYEYDFVASSGGYIGIFADFNFNQADVSLDGTDSVGLQRFNRDLTVPIIGGAVRLYPSSRNAITAEFPFVKFKHEDTEWKFGDFDAYLTSNWGKNFGALLGYRWITTDFAVDEDSGTLKMKGPYFGLVGRF